MTSPFHDAVPYLANLDLKPATRADNDRWIKEFRRTGSKEAHDNLIVRNLPMVIGIAKKFSRTGGMSLGDLVSCGIIGMHRAIEMFRPELGFAFSTYARWWIAQGMWSDLKNDRVVRLPSWIQEAMSKLAKHDDGPFDSVEKVAKVLRVSLRRAKLVLRASRSQVVQFVQVGDETAETVLMVDQPDPLETAESMDQKRKMFRALESLSRRRDRDMIERRFGLNGYPPQTLAQVGKAWGVTRERVRQIEKRTLEILRHKMGVKT